MTNRRTYIFGIPVASTWEIKNKNSDNIEILSDLFDKLLPLETPWKKGFEWCNKEEVRLLMNTYVTAQADDIIHKREIKKWLEKQAKKRGNAIDALPKKLAPKELVTTLLVAAKNDPAQVLAALAL